MAAERMFLRAGCDTDTEAADEEEGLSLVQAASVAGRSAVRGRKAKRVRTIRSSNGRGSTAKCLAATYTGWRTVSSSPDA